MDNQIIASDDGHPEIRVWTANKHPIVGFTLFSEYVNFGFSLTRFQVAQMISALQDADDELAAREVCANCGAEPISQDQSGSWVDGGMCGLDNDGRHCPTGELHEVIA